MTNETSGIIIVNGVTVTPHERYPGQYPAAQCRRTGLPMFDWIGRIQYPGGKLYSRTQRKQAKCPVLPDEQPVAWYQMHNGYIPLYLAGKGMEEK